jgi:hypothetical protein
MQGVIMIKAGGLNRPFRFKYRAIKGLAADLKAETLEELPAKMQSASFEVVESILYHGFRAGAEYLKEPVDFKKEDLEGWLEDDLEFFKPAIEEAKNQLLAAITGPNDAAATAGPKVKKP